MILVGGCFTLKMLSLPQDPDELLDVVDAEDRVVGRGRRADVHAQGLWHRAIHVIVVNRQQQVLMQQRSALKDAYPNCWSTSCAGHVDTGEDYEAAAIRELEEELGVVVRAADLEILGRLPPCVENGWEWIAVYRTVHEGPFCPPEAEVAALEWKSRSKVSEAIKERPVNFAPSFRLIWEWMARTGLWGAGTEG